MNDYRRGQHPNSRANFLTGPATRTARTRAGLAWARAWRIRNKPAFDAMYGAEQGR